MVASSASKVAKPWAGVPSSSTWAAALTKAELERLAGAAGWRGTAR